jgi:streptomycin 6-kinase
MDRTENTVPLLLYPIVAMETRLFAKPLPSKGYCIFVYLAVVAQQRVYMPQYVKVFIGDIHSAEVFWNDR